MPQTGDGQRVDTLTTLLTAITGRRYGLPQQNHPSDVLAEAYIDVLERRLHRANARVWRYSDDFRIATDSWSDALATVDLLEREVRRIGLTLNDSKTVIRRGDTYEASLKRRKDSLPRPRGSQKRTFPSDPPAGPLRSRGQASAGGAVCDPWTMAVCSEGMRIHRIG